MNYKLLCDVRHTRFFTNENFDLYYGMVYTDGTTKEYRPLPKTWCFSEDYLWNCHVTDEDMKRIDNFHMIRELLK